MENADEWDAAYRSGMWEHLAGQERRYRAIAALVDAADPTGVDRDVLDVGCGQGLLISFLAPFRSYAGIDISPVAIANAPKGERIIYFVGPLETYNAGRTFSVVIFNEVLYYSDFVTVLGHYRDLVAEGGFVVSSIYDGPGGSADVPRISKSL